MLLAASVRDLKQSGVLPWNAIELFANVSEMLIAWFSFLPCFLIWLLASLFLHSRYSFTMECSTLSCTAESSLLLGRQKVVDHFLDRRRSWTRLGKARLSPCTDIEQINDFLNDFSPQFTLFPALIWLVWSVWKLSNLNALAGGRHQWGAWICLCLTITNGNSCYQNHAF